MAGAQWRVEQVPMARTEDLRGRVLRPGRPPAEASWPGWDEGGAATFAAFPGPVAPPSPGAREPSRTDEPVATASVRPEACPVRPAAAHPWRLRGMATEPARRGTGAGTAVLDAAVSHVSAAGGDVVWCNARSSALDFYRRAGFTVESDEFDIAGIGPHRLLVLDLPPPSGR